jgi:hypothetical protein
VEECLEGEVGPSQDDPAETYSLHPLITKLHTLRCERRKMRRKRRIKR